VESGEVETSQVMPIREMERMMKLQDVILKAMVKTISWLDCRDDRNLRSDGAPDARGIRKFRYTWLTDRRSGKQSSHRVSMETVDQVVRLYREMYSASTSDTLTRNCGTSTRSI